MSPDDVSTQLPYAAPLMLWLLLRVDQHLAANDQRILVRQVRKPRTKGGASDAVADAGTPPLLAFWGTQQGRMATLPLAARQAAERKRATDNKRPRYHRQRSHTF
jgi:hypothetical protein